MTSICSEQRLFAPAIESVRARLNSAGEIDHLPQLLARLHWTDLTFSLEAPEVFEDVPDLPDRIRGALGRALERTCGNRKSSRCDAWTLLYGKQFLGDSGGEFHPFVITTDRTSDRMVCIVRLVGFADCWSEDVAAAAFEAFRAGIAIRRSGVQRVRLSVLGATRERMWFRPPAAFKPSVLLRFKTPLVVRNRRAVDGSLASLSASMRDRLLSVARWCDVCPSPQIMRRMHEPLWTVERADLRPVRWRRRSSTHPDGTALLGLAGDIVLGGMTETGLLLCWAMEPFHAGGGSSGGLGRFIAIPW